MITVLYALLSVFCTASLRITLKHCLVKNDRAWAPLIIFSIGGSVILLPFCKISDALALNSKQVFLLVTSGALFSIAGLLDVKAMKKIDASSGEIFHTLSFIISMAAGFIIFGEACSIQKTLGTIVITLGILFEARSAKLAANYGMIYKLGSALFTAGAVIMTKHLTNNTPPSIIILAGFLIPGIIYLLIGWREIPAIIPTITASKGLVVAVPVLEVAAYAAAVTAFAIGEFSTAYIVFQTTITAVLVLEIALYGWQHRVHLNRTVSAGLCALGAVVAIVG
jgi:drug/metabolite transporter (DMT)-like permease